MRWLLRQANVGDVFLEHRQDLSLQVQYPLALYLGLPLVAVAGVAIFILQRRNLRSSPRSLVIALTGCRVFILALLVAVLAGPYVRLETRRETRPVFALLFDRSRSMELAAGPDRPGVSRAKLAHDAVLSARDDLIVPAGRRFDLKVLTFARDITPLGVDADNFTLPEPSVPGGPSSRIGDAIQHVLNEAAGRPVAGIVVFSDGESTGGVTLREVAQACRSANVPVFAIPTGSAARARDVSVVDVSTSGQVAVGDTARVGVIIESNGCDGKVAQVIVRDGDRVLDTKEVTLRSAEQQQVELTFTARDAGSRYLVVEVPPFPDEDHKTNNTDVALLRVSDERIKVLYVEGPPRWDFRFLKNAMRRDTGLAGRDGKQPDIVLENEWRRRPEAVRASTLPRTLDELAAYHTVILGDASPKLLTPVFLNLLDRAVREKGVGLLVEVGPVSMPHVYDKTLLDLLPVQVERTAGVYAPAAKPFRLELTPDGALHEAIQLYDDPGRNRAAWADMLPYQWCVAAVRASPAATVLAVNPNVVNNYGKLPLIAWQPAGKGRVMLVGTDSTWLWRQDAADRFFYKFWGQSIRFVARADDAGKKSRIEVRPVRVQPGDDAMVELWAYADGAPVQRPTLHVEVSGAGTQTSLTLDADPNTKGRYVGRYRVPAVGDFRFAYENGTAEARLRVLASPEEMRYPNVNRAALQALAETTGGELVELTDADWAKKIVGRLQGEPKVSRRPPQDATMWDNWLVLAMLVVVYSVDVGLRRLGGLS
ncbi:MAG TPA: VWA domain-containing protein [Gemmataceae bacterium]|nr:VWA domain-containing protein [Gemmataceae bacterium]